MKIGIDARFYGPKCKGLGRYTQKLIEYLQKIDKKNEYYIFLTKDGMVSFSPEKDNFKKVLADFRWYGWKEQIFFPFMLNKYKLDLVHFCHFNVPIFYWRKYIVTIHDLILFHYPTAKNSTLNRFYYLFKLFVYHGVIRFSAKKAQKIISVSHFTKKDVVGKLKTKPSKIKVIYEGYERDNEENRQKNISKEKTSTILEKYGIIKPYLLYVGNAYPHKNLLKLCEAFLLLKKTFPNLWLVLVGEKDYFYQEVEKFIQKNNIENILLAGFVKDEDLEIIYEEAELYVFPSLYEGFGLPPLEAMAKGKAVVSSDRSCVPEILGNGAYYFDPQNIHSIEKSIKKVFIDKALRGELIENSKEILKKFSWQKMARETKKEYEELVK